MNLYITTSTRKKTYDLLDGDTKYILSFGHSQFSDYNIQKDPQRLAHYISRHGKGDWSANNVMSRACMSRWLLWSLPSLRHLTKKYEKN